MSGEQLILMRSRCTTCGCEWGVVKPRNGQACVFCGDEACGEFAYNAPRAELSQSPDQKRRMPSEKAIREHWRPWLEARIDDPDESPVVDDDGVRTRLCFACGMYCKVVEKAHITAKCNGGPDTVDNLHMLCRTCHKVSEALEGDEYWVWLDDWSAWDRIIADGYLHKPHIAWRALRPLLRMLSEGDK